jgi:hypothetical protein
VTTTSTAKAQRTQREEEATGTLVRRNKPPFLWPLLPRFISVFAVLCVLRAFAVKREAEMEGDI